MIADEIFYIDECEAMLIVTEEGDYVSWFTDIPVSAEGNTKEECKSNLKSMLDYYIKEIRDDP
ncbi:MAG: hypothetical protein E6R13_06110 [Spirochaetes bacterium]|nr:MAG: hypothetical protein E6R13_06110 [Spirochaetota bacterium]